MFNLIDHYFILTCLFLPAIVLCKENGEPRVTIRQGKLKGQWMYTISGKPIEAYLSIPYAKPPVGKLRFKTPVEPDSWPEERSATSELPICPQLDTDPITGTRKVIGQEDCLYLNVFKPKIIESTRPLPVIVYICGGGFSKGSSSLKDYGPEILLDKDIILITFNYRLDILGFLSTGDKEAPGNFGFKDQVAVLRWVRQNVKHFGGDPERVTVYGHSSGGASVHFHLLSPMSKGLFHKAISGSGIMYMLYPDTTGAIIEHTKLLGEFVKCPTDVTALLVKCLQQLPVDELFRELEKFKVWRTHPTLVFGPTVESETEGMEEFITLKSLTNYSSFVPWMMGFASEDGLFITAELSQNSSALSDLDNKFKRLAPMLFRYEYRSDKEHITELMKKFYLSENKISRETIPQLTNMFTDAILLNGILKSLVQYKGPVYLYYFNHRGQYSNIDGVISKSHPQNFKDEIMLYLKRGVSHGDELQYIFPQLKSLPNRKEVKFSKLDEIVSKNLLQHLTDFVTQLDISDYWQETSIENLEYMHMNSHEFIMKKHLLNERAQFWYHLINEPERNQGHHNKGEL
ncbi:esterase E4-like [Lycorma delicatula]|uniref:esterase E4-like n=1 Tax=Lycorma delicatula TaxID=130591 RepID=UPI003F518573